MENSSDSPNSSGDVMCRFFDEPLTGAELRQLTDLLRDDPEAAREFAGMARLDAGLEALGPAVPVQKRRSLTGWAAGAAAAAIFVIGGLALWRQPGAETMGVTYSERDLATQRPSPVFPPAVTRRVLKSPAAQPASILSEPDRLLADYFVDASPAGLTVPAALRLLEERIRLDNLRDRAELKALRFSAGAPIDPDDPDPLVRTPKSAPMTVTGFVEACAGFRQVTLNPGGRRWGPSPLAASSPEDQPVVEAIKVPPDFLGTEAADSPELAVNRTAARLEDSYGIVLGPEEGASFAPSVAEVTLLAVKKKQELLRHRAVVGWQPVRQVFINTRLMRLPRTLLPEGFDENTGLMMEDADFQTFLSDRGNHDEVVLLTTPSVIVRMNQQSKVEVKNGVPGLADWTGMELHHSAMPRGELLRVEGALDLGISGRVHLPQFLRPMELPPTKVEAAGEPVPHFKTEFELWLPDRSTGLFTVDAPVADGQVLLVALTATLIDAAGQPVKAAPAEEIPVGTAAEGRPGFVLSPWAADKGFVDVTGIPSGSKVKCPWTGKVFRVP